MTRQPTWERKLAEAIAFGAMAVTALVACSTDDATTGGSDRGSGGATAASATGSGAAATTTTGGGGSVTAGSSSDTVASSASGAMVGAGGGASSSTGSGGSGAGTPQGTTFFSEDFEDTNFASRGWYDGAIGAITTAEHESGSSSIVCHWQVGDDVPGAAGAWTFRHKFQDSNSVYVSVWWKFSSNWIGSGTNYHPHLILVLTNANGDYDGPAFTHLTSYVETVFGYPQLGLQDGQNIDQSKVNVDLVGVTENRSTEGCNGIGDAYGSAVSCYSAGSAYWNGRDWTAPTVKLVDGKWHHIEAYVRLNSVMNGVGVADGQMTFWVDGAKAIDAPGVLMRTGQWASMKLNQFMLAPYMQPGNGSPIDQTLWMDNLVVRDTPP